MEEDRKARPANGMQFSSIKLRSFFVKHLNIVYAVKSHLLQSLPQLSAEVYFRDLYLAIQESITDIEKQMIRMEVVFELLDAEVKNEIAKSELSLIDDVFASIKEYDTDPELKDLAILFYLQNIESIEMSSFQILQMAAVKLKNTQIAQLIKENYDEAKADRTLILLIASKYMNAN